MRLAFIGGGTMAEAMIRGILSRSVASVHEISVGEAIEERCIVLKERHGISATTNNVQAAEAGDLVVLSVKPQNLREVLQQLKGRLRADQVVISIVAGANLSSIMEGLNHQTVVRIMPNTPAQIGEGISLWTASPQVNTSQREAVAVVLETIGVHVHVAHEKYIDMATALSASGPAYVFTFLEALIDAGVYLGMPRDLARILTIQTVLGSVKLAKETGRHTSDLKDMVTSPGGTTVEGLMALEEGGFRTAVSNAVIAAYEKSLKLGKEG